MSNRQFVSELGSDGSLTLALRSARVPEPEAGEVLIRVEAVPVNPADIKLMLAGLPVESLRLSDDGSARGQISPDRLPAFSGRIGVALPIGNEGAGTVVAAGDGAQSLLGRRVSVAAGGMFADYRVAKAADCIPLPDGLSAEQGAAAWINPMTALAIVETMRREGHSALVLTAAASSLGQMLNRLCLAEGVALVNVVRSPAQAALLRSLGAVHVCDSSASDFDTQLMEALAETGATLAFDATGGGTLAGRILRAMDKAQSGAAAYSRYGSAAHKQLYFFGGLDPTPVVFERNFGMAWGMGGWLLQPRLATFGPEAFARFKARIAAELTTTFATEFGLKLPLSGLTSLENLAAMASMKTSGKALVLPAAG